jgi:ribonuclease HI
MTQFELLVLNSFHQERVASRRLAIAEALTPEQALRKTLESIAGVGRLPQLLADRAVRRSADAMRLASRRQEKLAARAEKLTKNGPPADAWLAWFDGSARPNPGACGIGAVLRGPAGQCFEFSQSIGYGSSSDAEYRALIAVLELALPWLPAQLLVYGDSRVVIDDVNQSGKRAAPSLAEYRSQAITLIKQLNKVSLHWIARHKNAEADALSQAASA